MNEKTETDSIIESEILRCVVRSKGELKDPKDIERRKLFDSFVVTCFDLFKELELGLDDVLSCAANLSVTSLNKFEPKDRQGALSLYLESIKKAVSIFDKETQTKDLKDE